MGDIINLRRARKARDRAAERAAAGARAARHGESKTIAAARAAGEALAARRLDGARREPAGDDDRADG